MKGNSSKNDGLLVPWWMVVAVVVLTMVACFLAGIGVPH